MKVELHFTDMVIKFKIQKLLYELWCLKYKHKPYSDGSIEAFKDFIIPQLKNASEQEIIDIESMKDTSAFAFHCFLLDVIDKSLLCTYSNYISSCINDTDQKYII